MHHSFDVTDVVGLGGGGSGFLTLWIHGGHLSSGNVDLSRRAAALTFYTVTYTLEPNRPPRQDLSLRFGDL